VDDFRYAGSQVPLTEAVGIIIRNTGLGKAAARADLTRAIGDLAVRVRGVAKAWRRGACHEGFWHGSDFHIPPGLVPQDIDWQREALIKPWARRDTGLYGPIRLEQLTVRRADIERLWPEPPKDKENDPLKDEENKGGRPRLKELAIEKIEAFYRENGFLPPAKVPDNFVCKAKTYQEAMRHVRQKLPQKPGP
jgi:hypothetical protein